MSFVSCGLLFVKCLLIWNNFYFVGLVMLVFEGILVEGVFFGVEVHSVGCAGLISSSDLSALAFSVAGTRVHHHA